MRRLNWGPICPKWGQIIDGDQNWDKQRTGLINNALIWFLSAEWRCPLKGRVKILRWDQKGGGVREDTNVMM